MPKLEKKFLQAIQQDILLFVFVMAVSISVIIRVVFINFYTRDMAVFLLPWVEELKVGGFAALKNGVGNYNIPYLLLLLLAAKLPIPPIITIKVFSILFDYVLAAGVGLIVYTLRQGLPLVKRRRWGWLAFVFTALLPLVMLNSSLWGQCDSVYGAFGVWAVLFLLQKKYGRAFIMLSIGFCFKLQIIFLLPVFVILYFVNKKYSVLWFLTLPVMLFVSTLPSVLQGGSPLIGFTIYTGQTGTYSNPFINYPSVAALFQDERWQFFSVPLVLLALLACLALMGWMLYKKAQIQGESLLLLAAWSVLACVCLLPSMHERYAFVGEVLLWAWFLVKPAKNRLWPALIFTFSGYCAYASYLFGFWLVKPEWLAVLNLVTLGWLTWYLISTMPLAGQKPNKAAIPPVEARINRKPAAPKTQPVPLAGKETPEG
ncbi:hypothetical protein LJC61_08515 [Ruminococcaceae bacterium OttesenSCG-928-A16]|nr:hypothetical protein [Ruminococcaceae bacterium OttesenSCG-928-A16]